MRSQVGFQSYQEGHPTSKHSPYKDLWTLTLGGKPVCKTVTAMLKTIICSPFFVCVFYCFLDFHHSLDVWSTGGSKQLYLPNPFAHTDINTPLHHTHSAPPVMPKIMNLVANCREGSHDNYQRLCVILTLKWDCFRVEKNLGDCAWIQHQKGAF